MEEEGDNLKLSLPIFRGTILRLGVFFFYSTKSKIVLSADKIKNQTKAKHVFARPRRRSCK